MLTLITTILGGVAVAGLFAGATFLIAGAMGRMNGHFDSSARDHNRSEENSSQTDNAA